MSNIPEDPRILFAPINITSIVSEITITVKPGQTDRGETGKMGVYFQYDGAPGETHETERVAEYAYIRAPGLEVRLENGSITLQGYYNIISRGGIKEDSFGRLYYEIDIPYITKIHT